MSAPVEALASLSLKPHVRFADCNLSFEVAKTVPLTVIAQQDSDSSETGGYGIDCAGNRIKLPVLSAPQFTSPQ